MKISEIIKDLLISHDNVVLPGLGRFETKYKSAEINRTDGKIQPPTKSITFNIKEKEDDEIILTHLMSETGLPEVEAKKQINDFVKATESKLKMKGNVTFAGIGILYSDDKYNIGLKEKQEESLLQDNYGMTTIGIPKKNATTDDKKTDTSKKPKRTKSGQIFKRILIAVPFIVLFVLFAIFYKQIFNFTNNLSEQLFNKSIDTTTTNTFEIDTITNNNTNTNIDTVTHVKIDTTINNNIDTTNTENTTNTDSKIIEDANINEVTDIDLGKSYKKYYFVVGSYKKYANATAQVEILTKEGYSPEILTNNKPWNRVVLGGYDEISDAIKDHDKYVKTHDRTKIWLLRNE